MKKILLVEDDAILLQMYKDGLREAGFVVETADTGDKAIVRVKSFLPDLVLLDIMLPGNLNGFDVLESMQRDPHLKDIPVVMLTNLDSEKETALKIGAIVSRQAGTMF